MRSISLLATIVAGSLIVGASSLLAEPPAQPKKAKMTKEEIDAIRARVYQHYWMEIEVEDEKGIVKDPKDLYCYGFGEKEYVVWGRRTELSLSYFNKGHVIVRPDREPMQVDIVYTSEVTQKMRVRPKIFKFDGKYLIVVQDTIEGSVDFREDGKYKIRPTSFTPTKENKYRKMTLLPCLLYDQD